MFKSVVHQCDYKIALARWGRCFWQDPNDGNLFLAYVTGNNTLLFKTSIDSGNSWSAATTISRVDDFSYYWNFDTFMDPRGHVHCLFRYNNSGCYQFLGKSGNTWTATSGEDAPQGFVDVDSTSPYSRDICGSMTVLEAETSDFGQIFTDGPAPKLYIALKASGNLVNKFSINTPFKGTPTGIASFPASPPEYPNYTADLNQHGVGPYVSIPQAGNTYLGGINNTSYPGYVISYIEDGPYTPGQGEILRDNWGVSSNFDNHFRSVPSENSGWTSGLGSFNLLIATANVRHPEVVLGTDDYDSFGAHTFVLDVIKRRCDVMDDRGHVTGLYVDGTFQYYVPFTEQTHRTGIFDLAESGTLIDVTFNQNKDFVFYMLKEDPYGREHLVRLLGRERNPPYIDSRIVMTNTSNYPSGIQYIIEPGPDVAGGNRGVPHIENFRCLKHPTSPNDTSPEKIERVATITIPPTSASGAMLIVWNPIESVGMSEFKIPHHIIDYTRSSGTIFNGIAQSYRVTNPHLLFDPATSVVERVGEQSDLEDLTSDISTSSYSTVSSGSVLKLEFARPVSLERLDLTLNLTFPNGGDCGAVRVSGSIDDSLYYPWGTIESGTVSNSNHIKGLSCDPYTVRYSTRWSSPANRPMMTTVKPCIVKYLKLEWDSAFATTNNFNSPTDLKVFGRGSTTWGRHRRPNPFDSSNTLQDYYGYELKRPLPRTEKFRHDHGTLPPGFITRGDFRWGIAASGKFTTAHEIPGVDNPSIYNGRVPSGVFSYFNAGNGSDDGFSVMVSTAEQNVVTNNASGILEVDIQVRDFYYGIGSRSGDYISFDMRADMNDDDVFTFSTHYLGQAGYGGPVTVPLSGIQRFTGSGLLQDWTNYRYYLPGGLWKLRWNYLRGPSTTPYSYGAVWIDNLYGVSGAPPGSIQGYAQTALAYHTGYINGFVESKSINTEIYGFASGYKDVPTSNIYGYTNSTVMADAFSSVFGYLLGNTQSDVLGFVFATSGVDSTTYPTGYIKGYVSVPTGSGPSRILGYVEGDWGTSIQGYLRGFGDIGDAGVTNPEVSGDQRILGFVYGVDSADSILGLLGGNTSAKTANILGYVNSRDGDGSQTIYGYVSTASGLTSNVHGITQGWDGSPSFYSANQPMIYGFVGTQGSSSGNINGYAVAQLPNDYILGYMGSEALVASGGGSVGGGPGAGSSSTSNVTGGTNWTWGIVKGESPEQSIYGYVHAPPGGTSNILGYVLAGADQGTVYAYSKGHEDSTSEVYGYLSGVYWLPTEINGYVFGISGIENSRIYGVLTGNNEETKAILGTLIGITSGINSLTSCPSHTYDIQPVPTVTLPTNFFNPFA